MMIRNITRWLSGAAAAVALVLSASGCSWTQRGAAAGGVAGAAIGAGWGNAASGTVHPAKIAVVSGLGGATTGAIVGDQFDQANQRDADREVENLTAQLADREKELAELRANNDPRVAEVEAAKKSLEDQLAALQSKVNETAAANDDLAKQNAALAEERAKLASEAETLAAQQKQAAEEAARLAAEKEALAKDNQKLAGDIGARETELAELRTVAQTKAANNEELKKQLSDMSVQLEETNRGLTLTILDQLLYKPGQAELTPEGTALIGKVAQIIKAQFPGREIIVEGHTDNQPIKFSSWKSNWELGAARALAVVHCMTKKQGFDPGRISAMSFGEFRPAADNSTSQGRSLNRRSVIVILPEKMPLTKQVASASN